MNPAFRLRRPWPLAVACTVILASAVCHAADASAAAGPAVPVVDGKAFVLMDDDSGQILASSNAEEAFPPADLTTLMTGYLLEQALKTGSLQPDDPVHVSAYAGCRGAGVEPCMNLPVAGHAPAIDLLRGIVVLSAGDAARAVAEQLAGSEAGFAQLMNGEATRIGMVRTHFVNATGLPADGHLASAHDLALLARAVVRDGAQDYPMYALRDIPVGGVRRGNRSAALFADPTVDGLKTGHSSEAGYCVAASAQRAGLRLLVVILGASTLQARAAGTRALFDWGFGAFEKTLPFRPGAAVASADVDFGRVDRVPVGIAHEWALTIPRGQPQLLQTSFQFNREIAAPVARGEVLGSVVATVNGKWYAQEPLVALEPVARAGFLRSAWQHMRELFR